MSRPVGVFAGVFDVNGNARKILQHDFPGQAGMTTGAASRDDEALAATKGVDHSLKHLCC